MGEPLLDGVRAELVQRGLAVSRRQIKWAKEALGLDADTVRAVVIDEHQVTVVFRSGRVHRSPVIEMGDERDG